MGLCVAAKQANGGEAVASPEVTATTAAAAVVVVEGRQWRRREAILLGQVGFLS